MSWYAQRHLVSANRQAAFPGRRNESEGHAVHVPSICLVEMVYLVEKGRIPIAAAQRVDEVLRDSASGFQLAPLDLRVAEAIRQIPRDDVPDMPDRIIAATALALDLPLVTRDGKIRAPNIQTIW